jgi:hypothetical protein
MNYLNGQLNYQSNLEFDRLFSNEIYLSSFLGNIYYTGSSVIQQTNLAQNIFVTLGNSRKLTYSLSFEICLSLSHTLLSLHNFKYGINVEFIKLGSHMMSAKSRMIRIICR